MTAKHGTSGHHASAAIHHEHAARYHREASRHYQAGKDYAHAAHQALVAHGHALQAIDRGNDAGKGYARHDGQALPNTPQPVPRFASTFAAGGTVEANLSSADHHAAAAHHHDQAARHHGQASKHCEGKDDARAAHEAQLAHDHAQHSVFHGNEAAKHHVEHYGKAGPTAELS